MNLQPTHCKQYLKAALKNEPLRQAVDKATRTALRKRADKVRRIPEWEDLRRQAHDIKRYAMLHLDELLQSFEQQAQKNGAQIHWAVDAQQAQQMILDIARQNNVRSVVKSKSLTTEEIHLNAFLCRHGIKTTETDLGEYIVQLLDQIPSHLTAPALHLSRREIGALFEEKLGVEYTEDPEELLSIARARLRDTFLAADMGISGANFAVAETGSLVILENEANARLSIDLPNIHVAVVGIEKVIPTLQDLAVFLRLLPPSATGQKQTVYVNLVSGPLVHVRERPSRQVHVIILDNGRSNILADPQLYETLFCIRCGACLNACPVYQQVGGHAYGWVYMGPIGATLIPQYLGKQKGRYAPFLSSLCGACFEACPVRINIPHHLLKLRHQVVQTGHTGIIEKMGMKIWSLTARYPLIYRWVTRIPAVLQRLYVKPFPVPGYTKHRSIATFDRYGFRKRYKQFQENEKKPTIQNQAL